MMMDNTYYGGYGRSTNQHYLYARPTTTTTTTTTSSRYESQKQRDWNTFGEYRRNHKPVPLSLSKCSDEHVLDFIRYLDDQLGETKQLAWGSLDALIGRLRVAFEENGGRPETNPFGAPAVRLYLRQVKDSEAKSRGI